VDGNGYGIFFTVQSPTFGLIELERQKISNLLPTAAATFIVMDFVLQTSRGFLRMGFLKPRKRRG
jgi:hypothetical protein